MCLAVQVLPARAYQDQYAKCMRNIRATNEDPNGKALDERGKLDQRLADLLHWNGL